MKDLRINEEIRARDVRLIDEEGEQMGIMTFRQALSAAQGKGVDLVEVAPGAKPPVCRLMDYGKFKYEQSKREKESKKRQKIISVKEVKLRLRIEEHDFQVKAGNAIRFLKNGDKVKVTIMFRGREISHSDIGHNLCQKLAKQVDEIALVEKQPKVEGRNMVMILTPKQQEQG